MATGLCVLLSVCVCVCVAFNVDSSFSLLKTGRPGSLFGLSVSLHEDLRLDRYLLLVGAPRAEAEPNVPANRTGGVYSCPITTDQSECSRMKLIDPDLNPSEDLIEDMWLGVSVASQGRPGGRVLACGHRFVKLYGAFKLRHMIGRCYLRGNDLEYNDTDVHWQNPDQPCSFLGDVTKEVMCSMGISVDITQTEVIVGSPGSYEWQGNVHVSWMNPDVMFDTRTTSFSNLQRRNIYVGYSVLLVLRLLSSDSDTVVTGAPKDSKDDARGSVLLAARQHGRLMTQQTLRGEQTGSYFGNAVAAADLDNDGWSDLLVGAPFYFQRQQEVGGAVYVYMNSGGLLGPRASRVLRGPAGSGFGMAVAAAGDLDQDGFQDFAVGAPFHQTGSVTIWRGSSDGVAAAPSQVIQGSSVAPRFRTFGYSLSGGHDVDNNQHPDLLVGSLDDTVALLRTRPVLHLNQTLRVTPDIIDTNGCDFCVQVEVCVSYRFSRGLQSHKNNITVHFTVTADVTSLKPRLHFLSSGRSVHAGFLSLPRRSCDTLRAGLQSPVWNRVEPLVFSLNVSLHEKLPKKKSSVQDLRRFPVLSQSPGPVRTQIHIQTSCGSDHRCHSNLQMSAEFTDDNHNPITRPLVLVLDSRTWRFVLEVNVSNCPSLDREAEDAHQAVLNVSVPRDLVYAGVRTKGHVQTEVKCSVQDSVLLCELGNPFKTNSKVQVLILFQFSQTAPESRKIQTELQLSTLSDQSDLFPVSISMTIDFLLQASLSLLGPPGPVSFSRRVVGESAVKKTDDVGPLLVFTVQVHVGGKLLGRLGNLQVEFDWPMAASNGKWLLYLTEILVDGTPDARCDPPGNIVNPLRLQLSKQEQRRRSLEEEQEEQEEEEQEQEEQEEQDEEQEQRRRSLEEEQEEQRGRLPVLGLQGQTRSSYILGCGGGASCQVFSCPLVIINDSAILTLRARLWESTLAEDYSDARSVLVRGLATLRLITDNPSVSLNPQTAQIEVHMVPDQDLLLDSQTPTWILVLAVLVGFFLLVLVYLLLWRLGFFVRRGAWPAALHQGRIMGKDEQQQQHVDSDEFLIQDHESRTWTRTDPKSWITSWAESN